MPNQKTTLYGKMDKVSPKPLCESFSTGVTLTWKTRRDPPPPKGARM